VNRPAPKSAKDLAPDPRWALFLDVDGTLLHLAETPDGVVPRHEVNELLSRLAVRLDGAVALISGRQVAELDRLFAPMKLPSAGLHGLEHRDAQGRLTVLGEARALDHLRRPLSDLAASHDGLMLEDKGRALAFHYRRAPGEGRRVQRAIAELTDGSPDLRLIPGKMVIEIKPRHADKGSALREFMAEPPFRGRIAVYIGDDVTDEDAFATVNELGGVSVHVDHNGAPSATAAHYHVKGVDEALEWLEKIAKSLDTPTEGKGS